MCGERRESVLAANLTNAVHLVHFEIGRVEFRPTAVAPADLAPRLSRLLSEWTGRPWLVGLSREQGADTVREADQERALQRKQDAAALPLVQAILDSFPGATVKRCATLARQWTPNRSLRRPIGHWERMNEKSR